jgi:5-(carboxyamino)imidazole ribonucleotide synthase
MKSLVGIIMGSRSDWDTMRHAAETLERSASPSRRAWCPRIARPTCCSNTRARRGRGLEVIIAGAGGAAHLPGMAAAKTSLPVLGVPVQSKALNGLDSLLSIVQMPAGIPVATLAIGRAGAINAALLAAAILGDADSPDILAALEASARADPQGARSPDPAAASGMKIGIIGAGQLGRMLALAGYPLGQRFVFVDADEDAPGAQVGRIIPGASTTRPRWPRSPPRWTSSPSTSRTCRRQAAEAVAAKVPFYPQPEALGAGQDRVRRKAAVSARSRSRPRRSPRWTRSRPCSQAARRIGLPAILKTRRLGYDGRGQRRLQAPRPTWTAPSPRSAGCLRSSRDSCEFERELSLIGVRGRDGETAFWPLAENVHVDGILRQTRAPWEDPGPGEAERHLSALLGHFGYVGVLTVEFFQADGVLLANEMAPRVHNSGHWTIEGAVTSQFENHLRAVLGLPLGSTAATGHAGMVNFIGRLPPLAEALAIEGAHYHDYGKSRARTASSGTAPWSGPPRGARCRAVERNSGNQMPES